MKTVLQPAVIYFFLFVVMPHRREEGTLRDVRIRARAARDHGRLRPARHHTAGHLGDSAMLAFYDFPAEHWIHRTHRVHVRHRTGADERDQGTGSMEAGLAMAFKLLPAAEGRWRRVNAPELMALVRAGRRS